MGTVDEFLAGSRLAGDVSVPVRVILGQERLTLAGLEERLAAGSWERVQDEFGYLEAGGVVISRVRIGQDESGLYAECVDEEE